MKIIRPLPKALPVLALLGIVTGSGLLIACRAAVESPAQALPDDSCDLPQRTAVMDKPLTEPGVIAVGSIPPIDAAAPTQTEMATFALG